MIPTKKSCSSTNVNMLLKTTVLLLFASHFVCCALKGAFDPKIERAIKVSFALSEDSNFVALI